MALHPTAYAPKQSSKHLSRNSVGSSIGFPLDPFTGKMIPIAAVETLRRGYSHVLITGFKGQNNVQAISTGPTGAYTTGQISSYGNTAYGSANTTFTGGGVMFTGSHDANLMVFMLKKGDPGYSNGVDVRQTLGADWQKIVKSGVNSCAD